MTPKEKAKEIVNKFINMDSCRNHAYEHLDGNICSHLAKQCALIAVDEIINSNPHSNPLNTDVYSTMNYWNEVKKEIENI